LIATYPAEGSVQSHQKKGGTPPHQCQAKQVWEGIDIGAADCSPQDERIWGKHELVTSSRAYGSKVGKFSQLAFTACCFMVSKRLKVDGHCLRHSLTLVSAKSQKNASRATDVRDENGRGSELYPDRNALRPTQAQWTEDANNEIDLS